MTLQIVRIATIAVMAALLIVFAWAWLAAADGTMDVARDRSLEPAVPMGALTVAPDATECDPGEVHIPPENDCVKGYVPLVGYVFWFGPLGLALNFAIGLAFVYGTYRHAFRCPTLPPRLPCSGWPSPCWVSAPIRNSAASCSTKSAASQARCPWAFGCRR